MTSMETANFASAVKHSGGGSGNGGESSASDTKVPLASPPSQDRQQFGNGHHQYFRSAKKDVDDKSEDHDDGLGHAIDLETRLQKQFTKVLEESRRRKIVLVEAQKQKDSKQDLRMGFKRVDSQEQLEKMYKESFKTRSPVALSGGRKDSFGNVPSSLRGRGIPPLKR
jgi:hypothetical protein